MRDVETFDGAGIANLRSSDGSWLALGVQAERRVHEVDGGVRHVAPSPRGVVFMTEPSSAILIVDDHALVAESLERLLSPTRPCVVARGADVAEDLLRDKGREWCGFLFNVQLGMRSGFELLDRRDRARFAPTLMICGRVDAATMNRAYMCGASLLSEPIGMAEIKIFSRDVIAYDARLEGRLRAATVAVATEGSLTLAETETLALAVQHLSAEAIAAWRGVTRNTYKTQVRLILEKLGVWTLEDACARVVGAMTRPTSGMTKAS